MIYGYSARELARLLQKQGIYVTPPTVIKAARRGKLTALKLRAQWLILPDEYLRRWIVELQNRRRHQKPVPVR